MRFFRESHLPFHFRPSRFWASLGKPVLGATGLAMANMKAIKASCAVAVLIVLLLSITRYRLVGNPGSGSIVHLFVSKRIDKQMNSNPSRSPFTNNSGASLMVVTTSNVWNKTQLMLSSIFSVRDKFDILVIDEQSNDETRAMLNKYKVSMVSVKKVKGVTFNWNLAYAKFVNSSYQNLASQSRYRCRSCWLGAGSNIRCDRMVAIATLLFPCQPFEAKAVGVTVRALKSCSICPRVRGNGCSSRSTSTPSTAMRRFGFSS
jgi:hypothetical protein